jgi:hypothetical protein
MPMEGVRTEFQTQTRGGPDHVPRVRFSAAANERLPHIPVESTWPLPRAMVTDACPEWAPDPQFGPTTTSVRSTLEIKVEPPTMLKVEEASG